MGSINCKEYVTSSAKPSNDNGDSTAGSYQPTCEAVTMSDDEYTAPVTVCNEADIEDNQMKQLDFDEETKILLIKQNGKLTAIGNKCSHYGAPLHTGSLGLGRVRCPWHGACFSTETGDIEDFPGLDSVPCYKVQVERDGQVKVRAKRSDLASAKRLKNMVKRVKEDERTFVVVGGGPAGGVCVETLRQEGFTGRIVLICSEAHPPYDRVKISKSMDVDIAVIQFRTAAFYEEHDIEVLLRSEAIKLDVDNKKVYCLNRSEPIQYDKIFIATGCRAIKAPIKGATLSNIYTVRDYEDAIGIHKLVQAELKVVCLGSSFIALEAAQYLAKKVKSVTVVGRENLPLKASFGEQIGERILKLFKDNNVNMIMKSGIREIFGNSKGEVSEVELVDGTKLPCDLLVMGTGSELCTKFLNDSGVKINDNGSIDTDIMLMTNIPDVYVGGDIANAPVYSIGNERATIGHYQLAQYHGRIAALNMTGTPTQLQAVPFFFTMLFGKGLRYAGYGKYTDVVIEGDLENIKFVAYFLNANNTVVAVAASAARDPIVAQYAELQSQGKSLQRCDIEGHADPVQWTKMLYKNQCTRLCAK